MSRRQYPRLGYPRHTNLSKYCKPQVCRRCKATIARKQRMVWIDVQVDWLRGNDECVPLCVECGKTPVSLDEALKMLAGQ